MIALRITNTKDFMAKLLTQETFDTFLFSEGSVTTFTTFSIDGSWHPDFFGEQQEAGEQNPSQNPYQRQHQSQQLTWRLLRPVVYDLIKGRHTPIQMRIVLKLADYNVEKLLKNSDLSIGKEQVDGLFLNLTYAKDEVTAITGTSLKIFTLDKSLDRVWDDMVRLFFQMRKISVKQT